MKRDKWVAEAVKIFNRNIRLNKLFGRTKPDNEYLRDARAVLLACGRAEIINLEGIEQLAGIDNMRIAKAILSARAEEKRK